AADDPTLHLVAGQEHHRDRRLPRLLRRVPLDRGDEDLTAALVSLLPDSGIGSADALRDLRGELALDLGEDLGAGFLLAEAGDTLELPGERRLLLLQPRLHLS